LGQRKGGVAAQPHRLEGRLDLIQGPLDPGGGSIDHIEHFAGFGQRHQQRPIAPLLFVGTVVDPFLALGIGLHERAIYVDRGQTPRRFGQVLPHLLTGLMNPFLQSQDIVFLEATQKIPRRRRGGQALDPQRLQIPFIPSQPIHILQRLTAGQHVIAHRQNMIRFPIRQMPLEHRYLRIEQRRQVQPRHQRMQRPQPPHRDHPGALGQLIVDRQATQQGLARRGEVFVRQPDLQFLLAFFHFFSFVSFHSKGLAFFRGVGGEND